VRKEIPPTTTGMGTVTQGIRHVGWIVLLGAIWILVARTAGWDAATIPNALAFGIVVYLCFRSIR
jgi:hypothetical protein